MEHDVNEELPRTRFIRLKNGDDVVSEVVEIHDDEDLTLMLINPMKIVYMPGGSGSSYLSIAFIPWVFRKICSEQQFAISFEDVLMTTDTSDAMNEYYWNTIESFDAVDNNESESFEEESEEPNDEDMDRLTEIMKALAETKRTYH